MNTINIETKGDNAQTSFAHIHTFLVNSGWKLMKHSLNEGVVRATFVK